MSEVKKRSVKLKEFHFSNYKCIDELSAQVDGKHFMVIAHNGGGKTSIEQGLDRNAVRLDPKDLAEIPIRFGAKNAVVKTTHIIEEDGKTREILIETRYRPSGNEIRVIDLSNMGELKPPVETIQKLLGESHNVADLMDLKPDEQFELLLKMLGGKISLENYESEYDQKYEERKVVNRRIKDRSAELKRIQPPLLDLQAYRTEGKYAAPRELPQEPNALDIFQEKAEAEKKNLLRQSAIEKRKTIADRIEELKKLLAYEENRLVEADKWLAANPEVDLEPIDERLQAVESQKVMWQAQVAEIRDWNEKTAQIAAYQKLSDELNVDNAAVAAIQAELDTIQQKMRNAIASLKIEEICPVLAVRNDKIETEWKTTWRKGLYYKHPSGELLPFNKKQISYGKMIVALAQLSGYINYGKHNLFAIQAWRELDEESQREILDFADANPDLNIQFMIEAVDDRPLAVQLLEYKTKEHVPAKED